ncbi:hypothetical protein BCV70DRAFT_197497 [Testicularia cyperi]|uniref:DUF676 domain-containing protein n=1 Tax=Testicularia cyperi TaxID=1882483 RepID=A0A317Y0W7_9BASI|nr:hypothetical protein BCV70DRAFT_197497 [Testicularia cyperi]
MAVFGNADDNPWAQAESTTVPPPQSGASPAPAGPGSSLHNPILVPDQDTDPSDLPPAYAPHAYTQTAQDEARDQAEIEELAASVSSTGMENKTQLLLLVFIHGFKGSSDTTFEGFPERLTHILQETYSGLHVQSVVYPTYDTRGSLAAAVESFVDWLTQQTLALESKPDIDPESGKIRKSGRGGGLGSVKIVLAGHSMGGLVAVDAALSIAANSLAGTSGTAPSSPTEQKAADAERLWPRILAVLAYDTPYFGVHPGVFKHGINKYAGYLQTAQNLGTFLAPMGVGLAARWNSERQSQQQTGSQSQSPQASSSPGVGSSRSTSAPPPTSGSNSNSAVPNRATNNWRTALFATGAVAIASGAAASAAYFNKDKINQGYSWVSDHLAFVSNLWDEQALRQRLDSLIAQPQILFHCFYTRISPAPAPSLPFAAPASNIAGASQDKDRTFIILPPLSTDSANYFTPNDNKIAQDEVTAHITMFNHVQNTSFFTLVHSSLNLIASALDNESKFGNQSRSQRDSKQVPTGQNGLRSDDPGLQRPPQE